MIIVSDLVSFLASDFTIEPAQNSSTKMKNKQLLETNLTVSIYHAEEEHQGL